jgi:hypothetical protein
MQVGQDWEDGCGKQKCENTDALHMNSFSDSRSICRTVPAISSRHVAQQLLSMV